MQERLGSTIELSQSLQGPHVSYDVQVDGERFGELLTRVGVKPKRLPEIKLILERGNFEDNHGKSDGKQITVGLDSHWGAYLEAVQTAQRIADGWLEPSSDEFESLLYTNRLPAYLATAPVRRGLNFAARLLLTGTERQINETLIHETRHLARSGWLHQSIVAFTTAGAIEGVRQALTKVFDLPVPIPVEILGSTIGIAVGTAAAFLEGPIQGRKAKKLETELGNHPKWRSIIKIRPK